MSTASLQTPPTEPASAALPAAGAAPERPSTGTWPPKGQVKVSVVVLTLNEEVNVPGCLASCTWCDDVHVLDSGSEDRTADVARSMGASVHVHPFESFGKQRNWAIDHIPLKHDWVFHLDADERFTPELLREIADRLSAEPPEAGFHIPHKLMFMGRWLKRAGGYPTYQMRLFHKQRMRFRDYGHGQREDPVGGVGGGGSQVGVFQTPYLHYAFSKGLYDWVDKHNRYSSLEALEVVGAKREPLRLSDLFARDPVRRRRAWKEFGFHLPFRPTIRFLVAMFISGGVLEGRAGFTYAKLLALYEQMTTLKLRLLKQQRRGQEAPGFERDTAPRVRTTLVTDVRLAPLNGAAAPVRPAPEPDAMGQMLPEPSPWTFKEKVIRSIWMLLAKPLFRLSFHNWYGFRARLLRLFGARVGKGVRIRPSVNVEIPWNLDIRDGVTVGDYAILYSLGTITIGERTIVSQYAHLCAGTHDHTDRRFPLIRDPIDIGPDAWIGADAFVGPNVRIGRLCVLGARSSAYKDLEPATVYVGNPAKRLKARELH